MSAKVSDGRGPDRSRVNGKFLENDRRDSAHNSSAFARRCLSARGAFSLPDFRTLSAYAFA